MNDPIVSSGAPITVLGGANFGPDALKAALKHAPTLVCADGGADHALGAQLQPQAVIGDMDSISQAARAAFADCLHPIAEQDTTDFDKVLRNINAPLVIGVGFLGDRIDHALAAFHLLLKYRKPVVLLGDHDLVFLAPTHVCLTLPVGSRVSLVPLTEVRLQTKGLKWEVRDGTMSMEGVIGSSNEAAAPEVEIRSMGGLAVILPPEALDAVVAALTGDVPAG